MTAADKAQLQTLAEEKEALKKRIVSAESRIVTIEKMEAALGGPLKPEAKK